MTTAVDKTTIDLERKGFRKSFWRMLVVIALQNAIAFGVNLLDNIMIGGYTELALQGVALVNQIQFLLQMLIGGASDGTIVLASRFWGEKNIESIKKTAKVALRVAMLMATVMFLFVFCFPNLALGILTDKPHVIAEGTKYMQIVCFSYFFFAASQVLLGMLRSVETTWIGFVNSLAAMLINGVLNYIFIYGKCGAPEMGAAGAALATLISRVAELIIVVVYIAFFDKKLHVKAKELLSLSLDKEIFRKFMKAGLPVILSSGSWGIAQAMQTAILGRLTDSVISANSIATTVFSIMSVLLYGSATTTSVLIGKTIGEWSEKGRGDALLLSEIKARSGWLQRTFLCLGICTGAALFLMKDVIINAYNIQPETRELALQFMTVLSITAVGTSYQMPCLSGIVRGGGDTKFILYNDLIFMWGIVLPSAFLSAFVWNLPPVVIFFCLKSDQILKCFVAIVKVNRYKWVRKI